MADEIVCSAKLEMLKNGVHAELQKFGLRIDMTGTEHLEHVQTIGITEEALSLGDVATPGMFLAINLDPTNFVKIRSATGVTDLAKLLPGEFCLFRMAATAPFAIADTAACRLWYLLLEA